MTEPLLCSAGGIPYNKAHLDAKDAEIERLWAVNNRLRELLRDAPIVVIDRAVAELRDEGNLVAYAERVAAWHARVRATLGYT